MSGFQLPLIDKAEAIDRLGGDEVLFAEMATMFTAESEAYCKALESALLCADAASLQREAHTIKSLLATFSFEQGRVLALRLEMLASSGKLDGAESLTAEVLAAVRQLAEELDKSHA